MLVQPTEGEAFGAMEHGVTSRQGVTPKRPHVFPEGPRGVGDMIPRSRSSPLMRCTLLSRGCGGAKNASPATACPTVD